MPPKNTKSNQPSKKTEAKKKDKIIEDKTFGLKNKKGNKQQKFIQQVQKQVVHCGSKSAKQLEKEREEQKNKKDLKKQELHEINILFRPIQQQVAKGVDPKSVLCAYFKNGQCTKGNKCKFSHDLAIERRSEKRSIYEDSRECDDQNGGETGEDGKKSNKPTSKNVCQHFLEAIESSKFGWFWECPNGDKCVYRHAVPTDYVLKKDRKKGAQEKEEISLEDLIERERAALGMDTHKVTLETFIAWKKQKLKEKQEKEKKETDMKKRDYKSGKEGGISGKEMFTFNPDLAIGETMDEGGAYLDIRNMKRDPEDGEEEEVEIHYRELDLDDVMGDLKDIDLGGNLSIAKPGRLDALREEFSKNNGNKLECAENGLQGSEGATSSRTSKEAEGAVAIDEDLFGGDDEDLDDLEEQLEEMMINNPMS